MRNQSFFSLAEANRAISEVMASMNDAVMRRLGISRRQLFEAVERPALQALPLQPYVYAEWLMARVGVDYHIEIRGFFYSVPFTLIGQQVDVRLTERTVAAFHRGSRIAAHERRYGGRAHGTVPEHMPPAHRTGPCGVGKSWLGCALGQRACRDDLSVLYHRVPRLFAELELARNAGRYGHLLRTIARVKLVILDDWGPETLTGQQQRDLLEIVEDRYDTGAMIITSQLPVDKWYDIIDNPKLADAILDRIVHNAYRIELFGDSLRKARNTEIAA